MILQEPSLNSKCLCESGKKYKHCCLLNLNITKTLSRITEKPVLDIHTSKINENDKEKFIEISTKINNGSKDFKFFLDDLKLIKKRNPDERRLYNLITVCYSELNKSQKAFETLQETYEKFPDYLFAKTGLMRMAFFENNHQKYLDIFGGKIFDLKSLFPSRNEFHISEALDFYSVVGIYFAREKKYFLSMQCLKIMAKLAPDHQLTHLLDRELYKELKNKL
jgi:tetratricopeptide (TPR) repeat protein